MAPRVGATRLCSRIWGSSSTTFVVRTMRKFIVSIETWVTFALLLVCLAFFISARRLPEGSFDPLGPGAAPEMVAAVLMALCAIILVRSYFRAKAGNEIQKARPMDVLERTAEPTPRPFVYFFGLIFLYTLAFQFELGHFIVVTSIFVFLATIALHGWHLKTAIVSAVVGVGLSVVLFWVLTKFFVIRLPGAF